MTGNLSANVDKIMKDVIQQLKIEEESILFYNIRLAIWEIFCNVIVHAHTNMDKRVNVMISWDDSSITLEIEDFSDGFDWKTKIPETAPEVNHIGGRGLLFIDQISDEFGFDKEGKIAKVVFKRNQKLEGMHEND